MNTGASLESVGRTASRIWTDAPDWTADAGSWSGSTSGAPPAGFVTPTDELHGAGRHPARDAIAVATQVEEEIRHQRVLALMLGDTSMGMINGYFGPRLLYPIGFSEHKVDQAWLIDRTKTISDKRVDDAFQFVKDRGVTFHWDEADAEDFTPPPPASSFAATWPCSTCWTSSRPTAWAGSTSSAC